MERSIPEMRLSQALQIVAGLFSVHPEHNLLQELIRLADGGFQETLSRHPKSQLFVPKNVPRFMEWIIQLHRHFLSSGRAETIDAVHVFHTLNQHRRMITNPPLLSNIPPEENKRNCHELR